MDNKKSFISTYLSAYRVHVVFTFCCSLVLASSSAVLSCLLGPILSVFMGENTSVYQVKDLLGENYANLLNFMGWGQSFTKDKLINYLPKLLIFFSLLKLITQILQAYVWECSVEKISKKIRSDLYNLYINKQAYTNKPLSCDKNISSILTTEIQNIRNYISRLYGNLPREILQLVMLSLVLTTLSLRLFVIFVIFLFPCAVVVKFLGKKIKKRSKDFLIEYSSLSEWLQQRLLGIETIKHYKTEDLEISAFAELTKKFRLKMYKQAKVQARTSPLLETVAVFAFVAVVLIAIYEISLGRLSASVTMSFFVTTAILAQSIGKIGLYLNFIKVGEAAVDRLLEVYNELIDNKRQLSPQVFFEVADQYSNNIVSCNRICVAYPDSKKNVLDNFTYSFKKQKIYLIEGPSGVGKTTLLKTLLGILEPCSGRLSYHLPVASRTDIGYMPQDIMMAPMTIAENVAYPHAAYDRVEVIAALESVYMWEACRSLKDNIETVLFAGADNGLSGGQAQRILLARVFYHKYSLIVLDEISSALDEEVEKKIYANLYKLIRERNSSIIQVSHRPAAKLYCDHVLCFA